VGHPPFCDAVLPGTAVAGPLGLDAEALHRFEDFPVEVGRAVEDQILCRCVVRKRFSQLLRHPCARWTPGHVAVQDAPSIMRDREEAVEHAEGERTARNESKDLWLLVFEGSC